MAGTVLTAPSTTPATTAEWTRELAYTEAARYGYEGVSLTNWSSGNTTRPEIAAGSVIEIDGAMCEYVSDETIVDDASIADGWCYIKHVVSGTTVTPTLTNTWGTWDTAKQGYYDGSGNRYSLFAMYRSGAVTKIYTEKAIINHDDAIFGYRYYKKEYTGTTTSSGAGYGAVFSEPVYDYTEVMEFDCSIPVPSLVSNGWFFETTARYLKYYFDNGSGVTFEDLYTGTAYNSRSYKASVTYKLTL